jgi:hypothetical protein
MPKPAHNGDEVRHGAVAYSKPADRHPRAKGTLLVPWQKPPSKRRREILLPSTTSSKGQIARPIRSETRATLVASIARERRWLDELISDPSADVLPHGMGVVRLCDLPAEWSRQNQMLGLIPR